MGRISEVGYSDVFRRISEVGCPEVFCRISQEVCPEFTEVSRRILEVECLELPKLLYCNNP